MNDQQTIGLLLTAIILLIIAGPAALYLQIRRARRDNVPTEVQVVSYEHPPTTKRSQLIWAAHVAVDDLDGAVLVGTAEQIETSLTRAALRIYDLAEHLRSEERARRGQGEK